MKQEVDSLLDRMRQVLETQDDASLAQLLSAARAADIADALEELPDEDRSRVLFALSPHTMAEVVVMLDEAVRGEVVEDLDTESLTELVSELPPDDAADVLGELPDKESDQILDHMPDEKSVKIEELLEYGEETAGGIMTPEIVAVPASATVSDAVDHVRLATADEDLHEVYIIDSDRRLTGTVPLRRLVTSAPATRLADICDPEPVMVQAHDDQETVLQIIRKYDVMSAAVVDGDERLIGRITHDDLLDVAEEEAAEDLYRMAGTDAAELETHSIVRAAGIRLTWLLPCMFGASITATVLRICEPRFPVALFMALMLFVPMIGATGGNSGIQISTIIVRGFATGDPAATRLHRALLREGRIALVMAPICGLVAWSLVSAFFPVFSRFESLADQFGDASRVASAVGVAMTTAILVAGVLGIALPFLFRRLGVDPAIASGPLITTLNDVVCVGVYMTLAMLIAT